jgi:hypothetical protein
MPIASQSCIRWRIFEGRDEYGQSKEDHIDPVGPLLPVPVLEDHLVGEALAVRPEDGGLVAGVGVAEWGEAYLTA